MQYVPKGANRAAASRRTARHAQRTPLPPRPGQVDDAKEAIGMVKGKKFPKGAGKVRCLECGAEVAADGKGTPMVLPHAKGCSERKKAKKAAKRAAEELRAEQEAERALATSNAPAVKEPRVGGDAHPKAQAFYADAKAAGWDAQMDSRGEQVRSDVVTAMRGTESIVIEWQNGVFIPPCLYTRPDGSETRPRNASDARKIMAAPAPSADALAARASVRAKMTGATPRARTRSFALNPTELNDRELAEALVGCKLVWVNRISGVEEDDYVRGRVRVHDGTSGRQVTFLGGSYRTVLVASITSITGGRKLAKV